MPDANGQISRRHIDEVCLRYTIHQCYTSSLELWVVILSPSSWKHSISFCRARSQLIISAFVGRFRASCEPVTARILLHPTLQRSVEKPGRAVLLTGSDGPCLDDSVVQLRDEGVPLLSMPQVWVVTAGHRGLGG